MNVIFMSTNWISFFLTDYSCHSTYNKIGDTSSSTASSWLMFSYTLGYFLYSTIIAICFLE